MYTWPDPIASAPRSCCSDGTDPAGSTICCATTEPSTRLIVERTWWKPRKNATTYSRPATTSAAGVPVMPVTGMMSPHGRVDASTGSPRCCFHTTAPRKRSSEYTVLFSVATSTWPDTINGEAYTSPSTVLRHASRGLERGSEPGPTPVRAAFWWYSGQSKARLGDGDACADARAEGLREGEDEPPDPPPHAMLTKSTKPTSAERPLLTDPS